MRLLESSTWNKSPVIRCLAMTIVDRVVFLKERPNAASAPVCSAICIHLEIAEFVRMRFIRAQA